jgi:PUB domain/Ubiquitin family
MGRCTLVITKSLCRGSRFVSTYDRDRTGIRSCCSTKIDFLFFHKKYRSTPTDQLTTSSQRQQAVPKRTLYINISHKQSIMTTQNDKKDETSSNIETTSDSAKEGAATTMDSADIETPSPSPPTMTIQLTLTALPGAPRIPLDLPMMNNDKVVLTSSELRQLVSTKTSIPLSALRLIYRGRLITDQATDTTTNVITEYKLENGSVLHCMGKPSATTATKQETSSSTTTGSSETSVATATVSTPTTATPVTTVPATTTAASVSSSFFSSSVTSLQSALDAMRASNSLTVYAKCIKTLQKVLLNIIDHPLEEKYRTIKVNNAAFQKHFHHVHNSTTVLLACGFQLIHRDDAEHAAYTMNASPAQWPTLLQSKATIDRAVQQSALTVTPTIAPAATGPGTTRPYSSSSSSSPSPFPFPPAGGMMPDPSVLQEHIANVMSNPQQIQAMMQVSDQL